MANNRRVDYTKATGELSSAYWNSDTQEAWDVYTRMPVAITENPSTGKFSEWVPTPKLTNVSRETSAKKPKEKITRVALVPGLPVPVQLTLMIVGFGGFLILENILANSMK